MSNVIISRSGGTGSVSVDKIEGVLPITSGGTGNTTGLAASATILATARTVQVNLASTSSSSFNGSAAITPGVTGTLAITNGGTGNTTGLAATATILATSRTIQVNLASTSTASFNGSAAVTPGVTGTLAIANGGTGNTTGLAASATILATARTIRTNLASTSTASFNGSAAVTPGVTGTLAVSNGGTGATTHTSGNFLKGAGTSAITSVTATVARAQLSFGYGTCSTAAATAAKTVTLSNFALISGARMTVKFTYANTNTATTLNVNSTGAKQMYFAGSRLDGSTIVASDIVDFVYDGTYWQILAINSASANSGTQIGDIVLMSVYDDTLDSSYLLCNGSIIYKTDYSTLISVASKDTGVGLYWTPSAYVVYNSSRDPSNLFEVNNIIYWTNDGSYIYTTSDEFATTTYVGNSWPTYTYESTCIYSNGYYISLYNNGDGYVLYGTSFPKYTTLKSITSKSNFYGLAAGNSKFVIIGSSGYSYYASTSDPSTWTSISGLSGSGYRLLYVDSLSKFIAFTSSAIYYSTTGTSWTTCSGTYATSGLSTVQFYDSIRGRIYMVSSLKWYYSTDGITWYYGGVSNITPSCSYSQRIFIDTTNDIIFAGIYVSTDGGESWFILNSSCSVGVMYNGKIYSAPGSKYLYCTSISALNEYALPSITITDSKGIEKYAYIKAY